MERDVGVIRLVIRLSVEVPKDEDVLEFEMMLLFFTNLQALNIFCH